MSTCGISPWTEINTFTLPSEPPSGCMWKENGDDTTKIPVNNLYSSGSRIHIQFNASTQIGYDDLIIKVYDLQGRIIDFFVLDSHVDFVSKVLDKGLYIVILHDFSGKIIFGEKVLVN